MAGGARAKARAGSYPPICRSYRWRELSPSSPSCPGRSAKRVFALDVPGIHVLNLTKSKKTWMAGTSPVMTAMQMSPELAFILTLALRMAVLEALARNLPNA